MHLNQNESLFHHAGLLFPSSFSPSCANAVANLRACRRSRLPAACSRGKTSHHWNSQRRKNHRDTLSRRATQGSGPLGTESLGHHRHRRPPRRGPRQNRVGAQACRIAGHAFCPHSREWLVSPNRRTSRPISLAFSRQSGAKNLHALSLRRRSDRRFHRPLSHGHSEMVCRTSHQGNVFLRLQRLLASLDEILHSRFPREVELFGSLRTAPQLACSTVVLPLRLARALRQRKQV